MSDVPLFERDPSAWQEHLAEGNASQARKRVAADLLIRDTASRVLLVDPTYKPDWDLPGGMAEANESPDAAARRELAEELGLDVTAGRLLVVDWVPPHGPWDDLLAFVFDGSTLDPSTVAPADAEVGSVAWLAPADAIASVGERMARRLATALDVAGGTGPARYLVDGRPA